MSLQRANSAPPGAQPPESSGQHRNVSDEAGSCRRTMSGLRKKVSFSTSQLDEVLEEVIGEPHHSASQSETRWNDLNSNGGDSSGSIGSLGMDTLFYPFNGGPVRPQAGSAYCAQGAPTPANESYRLRTLKSLDLLDSPKEDRFDRITNLAAKTFNCPISLVSLIDETRQFFKANLGLESISETPRSLAFCAYTLLPSAYPCLVVEDTAEDSRFREHKLVVGEPTIRFYAGAPLLTSDGAILGSLCVIDSEPHKFGSHEEQLLLALAHLVVVEAEKKRRGAEIARMKEEHADSTNSKLLLAVDRQTEGLCLVDTAGAAQRLVYVNSGWEQITGYSMEEVVGRPTAPLLQGPDTSDKAILRLREAIRQQQSVSVYILNYCKDRTQFWNWLRIKPLHAPAPTPLAAQSSATDTSPARYWLGIIAKANSIM